MAKANKNSKKDRNLLETTKNPHAKIIKNQSFLSVSLLSLYFIRDQTVSRVMHTCASRRSQSGRDSGG
jgi:hypothetical protein